MTIIIPHSNGRSTTYIGGELWTPEREKEAKRELRTSEKYAMTRLAQEGKIVPVKEFGGAYISTAPKADVTTKLVAKYALKTDTGELKMISAATAEALLAEGYRVAGVGIKTNGEVTQISTVPRYVAGAVAGNGFDIEKMSFTTILKWGAVALLAGLALPSIIKIFKKK